MDRHRRDYLRGIKLDGLIQTAKIKIASLPYIGNEKKMMTEMKKLKMMNVNNKIMTETLGYFRWHNLIHDTTKLLGLI